MLDLSPTKLIIIFVVAIVLLGPQRLPQVARQLGAAWAKMRTFSQRVDAELRQSIPDLPSSRDIVRYARSPITLLNELADGSPASADALVEDPGAPAGPDAAGGGEGSATASASAPDGATRATSALGDGLWPQDRASDVPAPPTSAPPAVLALTDPRETEAPVDLGLLAVDDPSLN